MIYLLKIAFVKASILEYLSILLIFVGYIVIPRIMPLTIRSCNLIWIYGIQ